MNREQVNGYVMRVKSAADNPPRLPGETGECLKPLLDDFPIVYNYFRDHVNGNMDHYTLLLLIECYGALYEFRETMFFAVCDFHVVYADLLRIPMEHPICSGMLVVLYISEITLFLMHYRPLMSRIGSLPRTTQYAIGRHDWLEMADVERYTATNGLSAVTKHVKEHTMAELLEALWLLVNTWERVADREMVEQYLLALTHRGMVMCAQAGLESVMDVARFRSRISQRTIDGTVVDVFRANYDFVRAMLSPLRMLCAVRFFRRIPRATDICERYAEAEQTEAESAQRTMITRVRAAIEQRVADLDRMPSIRSEMIAMFNRSAITYGDIEAFVTLRNMEPLEPGNMVKILKPPEQQQAWMTLNLCVNIKYLGAMNEDDPKYHASHTVAHHAHSHNIKLCAADACLRESKLLLRSSFLVLEQDFVQLKHLLVSDAETPYMLQFMGRMHVFFNGHIYECRNIEHALVVWALLVKYELRGSIRNVCYAMSGLDALLNRPVVFKNKDQWTNNAYTDGHIAGL